MREQWTNLNGLWEYAVTGKEAGQPGQWAGKIMVPFAIEAPLSGVGRRISPEEALWYRRTMEAEKETGRRYLLNFEAVDYQSTLWTGGGDRAGAAICDNGREEICGTGRVFSSNSVAGPPLSEKNMERLFPGSRSGL